MRGMRIIGAAAVCWVFMQGPASAGIIDALLKAAFRAGVKVISKSRETPKVTGVVAGAFFVGVVEGVAVTTGHSVGNSLVGKSASKDPDLTTSHETHPIIKLSNPEELHTSAKNCAVVAGDENRCWPCDLDVQKNLCKVIAGERPLRISCGPGFRCNPHGLSEISKSSVDLSSLIRISALEPGDSEPVAAKATLHLTLMPSVAAAPVDRPVVSPNLIALAFPKKELPLVRVVYFKRDSESDEASAPRRIIAEKICDTLVGLGFRPEIDHSNFSELAGEKKRPGVTEILYTVKARGEQKLIRQAIAKEFSTIKLESRSKNYLVRAPIQVLLF